MSAIINRYNCCAKEKSDSRVYGRRRVVLHQSWEGGGGSQKKMESGLFLDYKNMCQTKTLPSHWSSDDNCVVCPFISQQGLL